MKRTIEFFTHSYGSCTIHIEDERSVLDCGEHDIHTIFSDLLGKRICEEYADGCTIFQVSDAQIEKIKTYLDGTKTFSNSRT